MLGQPSFQTAGELHAGEVVTGSIHRSAHPSSWSFVSFYLLLQFNEWQICIHYFGRLDVNAGEVDSIRNPSISFTVTFPLHCFWLWLFVCLQSFLCMALWLDSTVLLSSTLPVPKRCTHVTNGQLLTIGTQQNTAALCPWSSLWSWPNSVCGEGGYWKCKQSCFWIVYLSSVPF